VFVDARYQKVRADGRVVGPGGSDRLVRARDGLREVLGEKVSRHGKSSERGVSSCCARTRDAARRVSVGNCWRRKEGHTAHAGASAPAT
jgi:hypothetical protein